jgi:hypothetical protein
MYTVIGGEADGQTYSRLYNALEGIKKAEGWSQCWTSDPYPDEAGSRLYVYPSEEALEADQDQAGPFVVFA